MRTHADHEDDASSTDGYQSDDLSETDRGTPPNAEILNSKAGDVKSQDMQLDDIGEEDRYEKVTLHRKGALEGYLYDVDGIHAVIIIKTHCPRKRFLLVTGNGHLCRRVRQALTNVLS